MSEIPIALIVAVAENGVIGKDNQLPWHIPEDLKWFKENTMGKPMIMGRNTFDSLKGILPGRPHIVISRDSEFKPEGVEVVRSIEESVRVANSISEKSGADEIMVIGGGTIYEQFLPIASKLYRTLVQLRPEGDAFFPELKAGWNVIQEELNSSNNVNFMLQVVEKVA